jgi:hypothetical protein
MSPPLLVKHALDPLFCAFFIVHIIATLAIDLQVIFPSLYPQSLQDVLQTYVNIVNDPLIKHHRQKHMSWFRTFIWVEFIVQLPLFFYLFYTIKKGNATEHDLSASPLCSLD